MSIHHLVSNHYSMPCVKCIALFIIALCTTHSLYAQPIIIDQELKHLRFGSEPEWTSFSEAVDGQEWISRFQAEANDEPFTLRLRQQDVKRQWRIVLNDTDLGTLRINENDMVRYWPIPPGALISGENLLQIEQLNDVPDDIHVGEFIIYRQSPSELLSSAQIEIEIKDLDTDTNSPSRITVLNEHGALQQVGAQSNDHLAVRPGIINTSNGHAAFGLPAGTYTIYAGRGFEYSLDSARVTLKPGESKHIALNIRREVPTPGYISADTHVHTLTHSGHGEATIDERMVTLASEGIELPIATDHNVIVDYEEKARELSVRQYFTPVMGSEFTTQVGHFNIFPIDKDATYPDYTERSWDVFFDDIYSTPGVKVAILNHARDKHGEGYRPFDPAHHNALVGANLDGWNLQANAMEILNSAAQQTNMLELFTDWLGMLNGGKILTPVGCSDSHDVGRHFVGQARTYIRANDSNPAQIDVNEAVNNFVNGHVSVSLGLLAEITVDDAYGPGDLAPVSTSIKVSARVLGPGWTRAEKLSIYANGRRMWTVEIPQGEKPGVKWSGTWTMPRPSHDMHLVAIASGPGVRDLYWPIAKPYQQDSPLWNPQVLGITGAVWIDGDGDGERSSAVDYAKQLISSAGGDLSMLFAQMEFYDEAVAAQVAFLLELSGTTLEDEDVRHHLLQSGPSIQVGFERYVQARNLSLQARKDL
ncbi:MAG: CehA/McbA family metallohydrolase [Rhodothermales bacterium]